jgi:hypothetical protein
MGFSYCSHGLCCDFCGDWEGTKKIPCPYGFCQAWACCPKCKAEKKHLKSSVTSENKSHKEICKPLAIEWDKKQHLGKLEAPTQNIVEIVS